MCGIIGLVSSLHKSNFETYLHKLKHRGPDDTGLYQNDFISLGHQRLSIQDLTSNGRQPMFSYDKRFCIIFNGEIYNHWEVREQIKNKYPFESKSDTETILYGYIEYGIELFNKLNGIFAFAIYDTQTNDCVLVRDQFGVKPIYYYQKEGLFAFSSEIKSFTNLPDFDSSINHKALVNYLHFLYSPDKDTPFQCVNKLLAGHYISFNVNDVYDKALNSTIKPTKYYEIPFNGQYSDKTEEELVDELDSKLFNAVKRQLLSDVPIGFFLSGGLDSSAVVAMAKRAMPNKRLKCYTIDSGKIEEEGFVNDLKYAKLVAKHLDVDLEIVESKIVITKDLDKMVYHLDEPQADIAPLHVLNICQKARQQGYVVLVGGTAGDDLFSGYRRHMVLDFEKYYKFIPLFIKKLIKKSLDKINFKSNFLRRIKKATTNIDKNKYERMAGYFAWIDLDKNKKLFNAKIRESIEHYNPVNTLIDSLKNIPDEKSHLNQMLYWEMKYFLTDHNLNYTDKLSMATGVEVRVPFLDKELVEFSTKIPPMLKLKGKTTKYLLKKVMEKYLPNEVIYRSKAGFGAPVREWILNDLDPVVQANLSKESIDKMKIFDYVEIQKLIKDNKLNKIDASYSILSLLAIESWYRQFVDIKKQ